MIDALYDRRGESGRPMVIFEGRFVQVENSKSIFGGTPKGQKPTVWGRGRKVEYVFSKGVWNKVPVK